jgi:hypothetical protein
MGTDKMRRFLQLVIIVILLSIIYEADSEVAGLRRPAKAGPGQGACPPDMALIAGANVCMDRYEFPNKKGVEPVRDVDLKEATQLCNSRGKRIPTLDEFILACGGPGKALFPYGMKYIPEKCRSSLKWSDGPAPSGSHPECERNGIYDLTGNLWEWVMIPKAFPNIAGGAWNIGPDRSNCQGYMFLTRVVMAPSVGVRCVRDATGQQKKTSGP